MEKIAICRLWLMWLVYRVRGQASTPRCCLHAFIECHELTGHRGGEVTRSAATMDRKGEGLAHARMGDLGVTAATVSDVAADLGDHAASGGDLEGLHQ